MRLSTVSKGLYVAGMVVGTASGSVLVHSAYMRDQLKAELSIDVKVIEEQKQVYVTRQHNSASGFTASGFFFLASALVSIYERRQWKKVSNLCDEILSMRDKIENKNMRDKQ